MNIRNPISSSPAWPPHAADGVTDVMGRAAGLRRKLAGRLSSKAWSEPQHLMLKACGGAAVAATLATLAAVGFVSEWKPLFPLLPATFLGAAVIRAYEVGYLFAEMAAYERRTAEHYGRIAGRMANDIASDLIEQAIQQISDVRKQEGIRTFSGGSGRGGVERASPATDAPNIVRPQFPNFWRH